MNSIYYKRLVKETAILPKEIQEQVLTDYKSYEEEARSLGKTEKEIESEFGNPKDIVSSYLKDEFGNTVASTPFYDKFLTDIMTILFIIIFLPINTWLITTGFFGTTTIDSKLPVSVLLKAILLDPLNIVVIIGGIIFAVQIIRTNKNRYKILTDRKIMLEKLVMFVLPISLVIAYFIYHGSHRFIVLAILFQTTLTSVVYFLVRTFTTKKIA